MKIFISTTTFAEFDKEPLDILKRANLEFNLNPHRRKLDKKEVMELAVDSVGIIAGTEPLDRDVLEKLNNLKAISRCGTGMDNVDLKAAEKLGIKVYNTPDAPTKAVAELTIGLILDCLRGISLADRKIRQGEWQKPMGRLLIGKTLGIVGLGRIGKEVSRLAQAFGAKVIARDMAQIKETFGAKIVSFDYLLSNSDIISLHVPGDAGCLIDAKAISQMKDGTVIINTSRGNLVDENALFEALKSKKVTAAGIDTPPEEPYKGKLRDLDSVIITPHIGSYAKESRIEMEKQAVENLLEGLNIKIN